MDLPLPLRRLHEPESKTKNPRWTSVQELEGSTIGKRSYPPVGFGGHQFVSFEGVW